MNLQDFMGLIERFDDTCNTTLGIANKEYALEEEKFNNFKTIATILRCTPRLKDIEPQDVALVFLMKHLISIMGGISIREDMRGRYVDVVNYMKLHYGMHVEASQKAV